MKVSCAVVIRNEKVLIQKRIRKGEYIHEFPMGRVDEGENFEQAAIRELREETSLEGKATSQKIIKNSLGYEIAFVEIEIEASDIPVSDENRKQQYFWMDWSEIPIEEFNEADKEYIKGKL